MKVSSRTPFRTATALGAALAMAVPMALTTGVPAASAAGFGAVTSFPAGNGAFAVATAASSILCIWLPVLPAARTTTVPVEEPAMAA